MMFLTPKVTRVALTGLQQCSVLRKTRKFATHTPAEVIDNDIVIVGGGPVGLALASALGSSNLVKRRLSVTLIEGGDLSKIESWNPPPHAFSNRVSSLTNASQTFLQENGSWSFVDEGRTCEVENMEVWDGVSDARIDFSSSTLDLNRSMARLTENLNLQRGLLRHLNEMPEVQIRQRTKVLGIDQDSQERGGWPLIHLDDGVTLRARLLIGADGFNSPVRSFAKIPSFGWSYDTQAIVATMNHAPRGAYEGPNTTAYQRFLPTGPIAFLPLAPTVSSLVWSMKPPLAAALLACKPEVLANMVNAAFRLPNISLKYLEQRILEAHLAGKPITLGEIKEEILWREQSHGISQHSAYSSTSVGSRDLGIPPEDSETVPPKVTDLQTGTMASFPLRFNHAESYLGEGAGARTVLVGDAAHTVHPLAGQGLNLGLADVECLVKYIEQSLRSGGDIGSYTSLLPYAQERYLANHTMMSAMDKLHKLYTTENEQIVWARSVGLEILNELDTVKAAIMMTAGAKNMKHTGRSAGWHLAGNGVQVLAGAVNTAGAIGGVLKNLLNSSTSSLKKQ